MAIRSGTLESVVMIDPVFWADRRVLLTGHTGFKGAWLAQWLRNLGAHVTGFSLAPATDPSLHDLLSNGHHSPAEIGDLREPAEIIAALQQSRPEIVIHMAAQAVVRRSYDDPVETFSTNIMGTVNLFEALRNSPDLKAVLVITSDKVYENNNAGAAFREQDHLGGSDPYSASKGCQDIISHSYRRSFFEARGIKVSTARAGNVVGGGDWSPDRLLKDVEAAVAARQAVIIRNPLATRPWQHVLEPLAGYLMYAQAMVQGASLPPALNFGPHSSATVETVVDMYLKARAAKTGWQQDQGSNPEEAHALGIDVTLAGETLGWQPRLDLETTIAWVTDWFNALASGQDMKSLSNNQISTYQSLINNAA